MAQRGRKTELKRLAQVAELEELRKRSRPEKPHLAKRGKAKSLPSKSRPDEPWLFTGRKGLSRGERNIAWVEEYLRVPEGKFAGDPLKLPPFMKEDFRAIYDNASGTRRAIISRARKNAKTAEAAMLVLLHLCGPEGHATPHAQLFSAAQSRDQAALIFKLASKMIRLDRDLFEAVTIHETYKMVKCPELENEYRALSAEATTAYGLSPCLIIYDELGQVRGPRSPLYEALETATAAQANPLSVIISTQAPNEADLLSLLIDDALAGHDPKTVLRFNYAGPEHEDPFTVAAIRAANPAVDIFMNRDEVLGMAANARRMPARQAEFENLVLKRRVETNNPFVSAPLWRGCGGEVAAGLTHPLLRALVAPHLRQALAVSACRGLPFPRASGTPPTAWSVPPRRPRIGRAAWPRPRAGLPDLAVQVEVAA